MRRSGCNGASTKGLNGHNWGLSGRGVPIVSISTIRAHDLDFMVADSRAFTAAIVISSNLANLAPVYTSSLKLQPTDRLILSHNELDEGLTVESPLWKVLSLNIEWDTNCSATPNIL